MNTRVMVVTGAASGIGADCMRLWRERGGVAAGLDLDGTDDGVIACDVTSEDAVIKALDEMWARTAVSTRSCTVRVFSGHKSRWSR